MSENYYAKAFFILAAIIFINLPNNASAAVYTVTNATDVGDGVCDSVCTFREAINKANATTADDEIVFAVTGTILLSIPTVAGSNIVIPDEAVSGRLKITGPGADVLTIRQVIDESFPLARSTVFTIAENASAEINAVTVSGGWGTPATFDGGAITNRGSLTLNKVILTDNKSTNAGGIFNTGILTINYSSITNNDGFNVVGAITNLSGVVTLTNSTITGNSGTAIRNQNRSGFDLAELTLNNSTISGNRVGVSVSFYRGVAIENNIEAKIFINNSTISDNQVLTSPGSEMFGSGI